MLKGRSLIDIEDFSISELDEIFDLAINIIDNPQDYTHICDGKLMSSLFLSQVQEQGLVSRLLWTDLAAG